MTPVLQWIKSHVVVVICIVLIVGAPVASYIVAGGMVESARSDLQGRASGLRDLKSNRTTTVSLEVPGSAVASISAAPNQRLVDAYREAVEKISGQADLIRAAGLAHNRNIHGRTRSGDELMPGHFPVPPGGRTGFEEMPPACTSPCWTPTRGFSIRSERGCPRPRPTSPVGSIAVG